MVLVQARAHAIGNGIADRSNRRGRRRLHEQPRHPRELREPLVKCSGHRVIGMIAWQRDVIHLIRYAMPRHQTLIGPHVRTDRIWRASGNIEVNRVTIQFATGRHRHGRLAAKRHLDPTAHLRRRATLRTRNPQLLDHQWRLSIFVAEVNPDGIARESRIYDLPDRASSDIRRPVQRRQVSLLGNRLESGRPCRNPVRGRIGGNRCWRDGKLNKQSGAARGGQSTEGHSGRGQKAKRPLCPIDRDGWQAGTAKPGHPLARRAQQALPAVIRSANACATSIPSIAAE